MIKIRCFDQPAIRPTQIDLCNKSSNTHLRLLQSEAKKLNEFIIISISKKIFNPSAPVIYFANEQNKHDTGELRELFFKRVENGHYPNLMFILACDDPTLISKYTPINWHQMPPANIMYLLELKDQADIDNLLPKYLGLVGYKAISISSQTSEITLLSWLKTGNINWVIQKNDIDVKQLYNIFEECEATNTPYYGSFKNKAFPSQQKHNRFPDELLYAAYDRCNKHLLPQKKHLYKDIFGTEYWK